MRRIVPRQMCEPCQRCQPSMQTPPGKRGVRTPAIALHHYAPHQTRAAEALPAVRSSWRGAPVQPPARCTLNYITLALPGIYAGTAGGLEESSPLPPENENDHSGHGGEIEPQRTRRTQRAEGEEAGMWAAMLTCDVNIAVFAAFHMWFDLRSVADAEFKPAWAHRQLDVSCYGWQRWQGSAKGWQGCCHSLAPRHEWNLTNWDGYTTGTGRRLKPRLDGRWPRRPPARTGERVGDRPVSLCQAP